MTLRIAGMTNDSIVDGPGLRLTIYVQGCPHHCDGCHNPQTHSFEAGTNMDICDILSKVRNNPLLDGVTFSGGEPFCQAEALSELGKNIHEMGLNVVTYTGYTFEWLMEHFDENHIGNLLSVTDLLIDGPFIKDKQSYQVRFRGSSNQRILDCKESICCGYAVNADMV